MGMNRPFCGEGTPKQAAVMLSVFTLIGCILWLSWSTYQIMWLTSKIDEGENPCEPNPCLHGGVCFSSDKGDNRLGYVCDCLCTGFQGIHCNESQVRRESKKSCGEYYKEGARHDGYYYIDPDGPASNDLSPIRVRCEFRGNRAYTLLDHEYTGVRHFSQHYIYDYARTPRHSDRIEIRAHYLEYLNYDEKLDSAQELALVTAYVNAIIDQAQHCEQKFVFRCRNWPLTDYANTGTFYNTSLFGGLGYVSAVLEAAAASNLSEITAPTVSTPGAATTNTPIGQDFNAVALDMSGEVPVWGDEHKCACYLDDTCNNNDNSNDEYRCNCDKDEEAWEEDVAVLTKEKHRQFLPIGGVIIGTKTDDDSDQEAYVELTPLRCYEEFDVIDPYSVAGQGGYEKKDHSSHGGYSTWEIDGFNIMWGCIIAFMVITAMLLLASFILLMGILLNNGGAVIFWLVMVVIMNIMIFILLCVRWYFLGFEVVVWELACQFLWMCITFYGMAAVVGFLDDLHGRNN